MSNTVEPGDANRALNEIGRRERQVIDAAIVPAWYWWVVAAASVGLGLVVDGHNAAAIALTAPPTRPLPYRERRDDHHDQRRGH